MSWLSAVRGDGGVGNLSFDADPSKKGLGPVSGLPLISIAPPAADAIPRGWLCREFHLFCCFPSRWR
jgi:hypothetical protein